MGRMKLVVLTAFAAVFLAGCSPLDDSSANRLAMPIAGSEESQTIWFLWLGTWIAVLVVFVVVFGMILYAPLRYRRRDVNAPAPNQVRYNLPLEALYTIAPVIAVSIFFFHTVQIQNSIVQDVENPDHTVEVIASKWQWSFNYVDPEATGGDTVHDVGDQADTENLPTLYLPVNESVRFELVSADVLHSFWIPEFYYKLDVIPGNIPGKNGEPNSFTATPNRTGVFTGRCAELCGVYHSRMLFKVHVVERDEYDAHMADLKKSGQVGRIAGSDFTTKIVGLNSDGDEN